MHLEDLTSCAELTTEDAEQAARSSTSMRALLAWAQKMARPGEGAPKLLMAIARLARADWVDGTPYVEIAGTDSETTVSIFTDHGMGIRERLVPLARMQVPIDEFARAIRLAPQLVSPFRSMQRGGTLILAPPEMSLEDAREAIAIDESSLHEQARKTAPPPPPTEQHPPGIEQLQLEEDAPETRRASFHELAEQSGVHTHPTVRRMVAVRPEALPQDDD